MEGKKRREGKGKKRRKKKKIGKTPVRWKNQKKGLWSGSSDTALKSQSLASGRPWVQALVSPKITN
jgi:hypothetical protein